MEVIVAVLILGTMAVTLYASLFFGFGVADANREELRATQILLQKTEAVRLCTWGQLTNFNFQESYDPLGAKKGRAGTLFTGSVITNLPGNISDSASYKPDMRLVTVTVFWTNFNGKQPIAHSRQMETQIAKYGLQDYIWGSLK
jgi:type II secretory pathway pseudopilin PulG